MHPLSDLNPLGSMVRLCFDERPYMWGRWHWVIHEPSGPFPRLDRTGGTTRSAKVAKIVCIWTCTCHQMPRILQSCPVSFGSMAGAMNMVRAMNTMPQSWWLIGGLKYGGFQKWGYPQIIIHFNRIFPEINHPAIGVPPFLETPICCFFFALFRMIIQYTTHQHVGRRENTLVFSNPIK